MRTLTKSEWQLLGVTGLLGLGLLTVYGFGWIQSRQTTLDAELRHLQFERREGETLLADQAIWQKRAEWLQQTLPVLGDEGKTKAEILETALQGARNQHLQILEQTLGETQLSPLGANVSAKLRVSGTMEDLCRWISALQSPARFYTVTALSLQADEADQTVIASITIKRFFKP